VIYPNTARMAEIFFQIAHAVKRGALNYLHSDQNAPGLRKQLPPRACWMSAIILYRNVRTSTMPISADALETTRGLLPAVFCPELCDWKPDFCARRLIHHRLPFPSAEATSLSWVWLCPSTCFEAIPNPPGCAP
jgi:hypothetical protein